MEMGLKMWIKLIILVVYVGLMTIVPEMPNSYTLIVNCLGFFLTIISSVFLLWFLETRPIAQKNLLNRILVLFVLLLLLTTVRSFLTSVLSYFWNMNLAHLIEEHPLLTVELLSTRSYMILTTTVMCSLSGGRLLLFVNPVLFNQIRPSTGACVVALIAITTEVIDIVYNCFICADQVSIKHDMVMLMFKIEMGIPVNFTTPTVGKDQQKPCFHLPIITLMTLLSILLEVSKLSYILIKEFIKFKKANQVAPRATQTNVPSLGPSLPKRPNRMHNSSRSKSLTEIEANLAKQIVLRRHSFSQLESKQLKDNENKVLTFKEPSVAAADRLKNKKLKRYRNVIQLVCLRTGSFITVFGLIGLITLVTILFKFSSSIQSSGIMIRLISYILVILLVYFDKDILEFVRGKLN